MKIQAVIEVEVTPLTDEYTDPKARKALLESALEAALAESSLFRYPKVLTLRESNPALAKVKPGYFYLQFPDETVEQAIDSHSIGFQSIEDAIGEANAIEKPGQSFVVLDDQLVVVAESVTK